MSDRPISAPRSTDRADINAWRKSRREECIAWRTAIDEAQRGIWDRQIAAALQTLLKAPATGVTAFYWPHQAEFDARSVMGRCCDDGAMVALPEVAGKGLPLRFRRWWPDAPMVRGMYDIPVPDGTPEVRPDLLLVPMSAFDDCAFRLGYGGGYYDRSLAALKPRVVAVGVSYEYCRLPTIYPQAHDCAMDFVVTEAGVYAADNGLLVRLDADAAHARLQKLRKRAGAPEDDI